MLDETSPADGEASSKVEEELRSKQSNRVGVCSTGHLGGPAILHCRKQINVTFKQSPWMHLWISFIPPITTARDITTHDAHCRHSLQRRPCRLCEAGPLVDEVAVARSNPQHEVVVHRILADLVSTRNRLVEMRRQEAPSVKRRVAMRFDLHGARMLRAQALRHRNHPPRRAHSAVRRQQAAPVNGFKQCVHLTLQSTD